MRIIQWVMNMKYDKLEQRAVGLAAVFVCIAFSLVALFLFIKYGLSILLPFLIGWSVAMAIVPISRKLAGKNEKRQKAVAVMLFIGLILLVVLIITLAFDRLLYEAQRLMERISDDSEHVYDLIGDTLDFAQSVTEHIPFLSELTMGDDILGLRQRIDTLVGEVISNFVSGVSKKLPVWLGAMASAIPSFILFVIVTLISGFYFCVDLGGIHSGIKSLLPTGASEKLAHIKRRVLGTALRYLRAYILLLLMTFGELFIGFSILKIDYALLLAAVIALIDILPVLGVGSVLIPWAAVVLISGNYYLGVGLFILYGCVALVRQISEPKIVGGSLGIHPLLTLISMYAGFKLFGLFGMIIGPAVALVVKSIITTVSLLGEERSR